MSGLLGVKSQTAMIVVFSVSMLIFYWPLSVTYAISALVGGSLGQGNIKKAKRVILYSYIICFTMVLLIILILNNFAEEIVSLYVFNGETQILAQ